MSAGLYDAEDNLVASWDTLINTYGMDVSKKYTSSNYNTETASPYCVLKNNSELANGVNLIVADGITNIGDFALYDSSITNIYIPNSVTTIGSYAFRNSKLQSVDIPDSVTSIESCAFLESSLVSATIGRGVAIWGDSVFYKCKKLESVTIPYGITKIGVTAFSRCSVLKNVIIPDSVTFIDTGAFGSCEQLESITIPSSVTSIGEYAFRPYVFSKSIPSITFEGTIAQWNAITKADNWKGTTTTSYISKVICTDGEIAL